jgi:acyl-CoA reductase-like NAD-dependent aldehyde dehydrogenase
MARSQLFQRGTPARLPSWRVDHMPYGGVKDSGIGREGLRFAIEDMTEIRLLAVRTPPSF